MQPILSHGPQCFHERSKINAERACKRHRPSIVRCSCQGSAGDAGHSGLISSRRAIVLAGAVASLRLPSSDAAEGDVEETWPETDTISPPPDTTITDRVFFDIGVCQQGIQANRTLGENAFCSNPESLGRVVIGLYGRQVPRTVENFLALIKGGAYNRTLFNKVLPGEYVAAGKQGSPRMGEVAVAAALPPNEDLMLSKSYALDHRRAGTVSLNLSHSEDDPVLQQSRSYRNVSFLITTGPGPATSLDGTNVVFGKVLEGMETVSSVTRVPTFKPVNDRLLALNRLGSMLGDERAEKTRRKWGRPLKPILITNSGIL